MNTRDSTDLIVIHCSATPPQRNIGAKEIREWHLARGWADIGYHLVIKRNGLTDLGRPLQASGAHAAGHNANSVGIGLVGGLYANGTQAKDDWHGLFTPDQGYALRDALRFLQTVYPSATVVGHRDLSPDANKDGKITPNEWLKTCPGFNVANWLTANGF